MQNNCLLWKPQTALKIVIYAQFWRLEDVTELSCFRRSADIFVNGRGTLLLNFLLSFLHNCVI